MAKKFPLNPPHPERICWGCDRYCPARDMACGNGAGRAQHPAEMMGDDWYMFGDWDVDSIIATDKSTAVPRGLEHDLPDPALS